MLQRRENQSQTSLQETFAAAPHRRNSNSAPKIGEAEKFYKQIDFYWKPSIFHWIGGFPWCLLLAVTFRCRINPYFMTKSHPQGRRSEKYSVSDNHYKYLWRFRAGSRLFSAGWTLWPVRASLPGIIYNSVVLQKKTPKKSRVHDWLIAIFYIAVSNGYWINMIWRGNARLISKC
jgi:hypothetical protein